MEQAYPYARKNSESQSKYSSPFLNKFNLLGTLATRELITNLVFVGESWEPVLALKRVDLGVVLLQNIIGTEASY